MLISILPRCQFVGNSLVCSCSHLAASNSYWHFNSSNSCFCSFFSINLCSSLKCITHSSPSFNSSTSQSFSFHICSRCSFSASNYVSHCRPCCWTGLVCCSYCRICCWSCLVCCSINCLMTSWIPIYVTVVSAPSSVSLFPSPSNK